MQPLARRPARLSVRPAVRQPSQPQMRQMVRPLTLRQLVALQRLLQQLVDRHERARLSQTTQWPPLPWKV